ncbi:MAG TPA: LptE family protein [Candidatus Polarisedimenticolaceae bacterium]|nr:LptE family protein [Candidatus Polarisedimenticolaceae bacterium]
MPRRAALAAVLAAALGSSACGYRLAGGNSFLPEHIKIIALIPFANRTVRPEIEQRVTEELARELARRGRYKIVTRSSEADATLEGAVTGYHTEPVRFATTGRASRLEAVVTVGATLRETRSDRVLWRQDGLLFREQFDVPETGELAAQENLALEDIARGVAGALATSILEGF